MASLKKVFLDCMQVRHFSAQTQTAYLRWVNALVKETHQLPDTLTDSQLKDYLWSLSLKRKLSTSSCLQAFHALNFFYREVLNRTFTERLLPPMKRQQKIPDLLTRTQVRQIFNACHQLKYLSIMSLCYGCGLRISEATAIAVSDIDGQQRTLHVHLGKGAKDRIVTLPLSVLERLRAYWRAFRPDNFMFFGQNRARAINVSSAQKAYKRAKQDAGVTGRGGIHALRHAYATHQLMAGMPLAQLQHNLGHKDIRTTLHYVHWLPHYQREQDSQFDLLEQLGHGDD
jgi:site-specific recombinase XerD